MASPSVTYSFANSTTADATQVNQNFTDLINGITDGTKDLSVSAFTAAGTATLNGNVNLGNATADDLVITASLNSSIANKTTFTNDLGSATSGFKSLYLASNDSASRSVRLIAGAVTASYTITLPVAVATETSAMIFTSAGVGSFSRLRSYVYLSGGSGHGSSGTAIRRFTTADANVGGAITYADSATTGSSFTINETGLYAMGWHDRMSGGGNVLGFSVNQSDLTIAVESLSWPQRLFYNNSASTTESLSFAIALLTSGDVLRFNDGGRNNDSAVGATLAYVVKIG